MVKLMRLTDRCLFGWCIFIGLNTVMPPIPPNTKSPWASLDDTPSENSLPANRHRHEFTILWLACQTTHAPWFVLIISFLGGRFLSTPRCFPASPSLPVYFLDMRFARTDAITVRRSPRPYIPFRSSWMVATASPLMMRLVGAEGGDQLLRFRSGSTVRWWFPT